MSALREAVKNEMKWDTTDNGAVCLNTTGNACVDMFGRAGSMRGASEDDRVELFVRAFNEDALTAVKLLFYTRDIRGGYGERDTFNDMFEALANKHPDIVEKNLWAVLEFGRAKDLYYLIGTKAEDSMWAFMKNQFELDYQNMQAGNSTSLLAKWIATPDSKSDNTSKLGKLTAKKLGYSFKEMSAYKKKLRELRRYLDIPEAKMCAGKWDEIEYSKCASRFLLNNRKAFKKHDDERWEKYLADVEAGKTNMNMGAVTPVDIYNKIYSGDYSAEIETMWRALPDYCEDKNALVICDTSGSMYGYTSNKGPVPAVVAQALSIYFAQRNKGCLKNLVMSFSSYPKFIELTGDSLKLDYEIFRRNMIIDSTNLEAAFRLLLSTALNGHLAQEDMPDELVVISDMQINECSDCGYNKMPFYNTMKIEYEKAGYKIPSVAFWNVNAAKATFHAACNEDGVTVVSGYSAIVFKQLLDNIGVSALELMNNIINSERYSAITI